MIVWMQLIRVVCCGVKFSSAISQQAGVGLMFALKHYRAAEVGCCSERGFFLTEVYICYIIVWNECEKPNHT